MKFSYNIILLPILFSIFHSCAGKKENVLKKDRIFIEVGSEKSGIDFANILTENDSVNYFNYGYMYMGGGVAIGDLNNDGLQDVYFTGNMVDNILYLNKGNLNFEDISTTAGVKADNRWITGVTMADVNADGWLDIYVSVSGIWTTKKNLLYINQGPNENGIPVFTEEAEAYGIADSGNSVQGTFFDYDNDGDLDLYVINYPPTDFRTTVPQYSNLMKDVTQLQSNSLYRNNGDNTFTNVTNESGLLDFGLSLSAAIGDYNSDGWQDIYVSNDFASPDNFYFNNGDGTFTDQIKQTINQTAFFGMGSDVADFNNDGLLDFFQLDMTPEDNRRSKANMQSMNVQMFDQIDRYGFHTQYMHNTLQLNVGNNEKGLPRFSNIPRLAGIALTDWSWSALFADFDNDGWKDLFVTNGTRREINNKDYFKKIGKEYSKNKKEGTDLLHLIEAIPSEKIENYAFQNNGDLTFKDVGESWGVDYKGFSNGAAYCDLDNDGDLDLVVNNLDETSILYENTTSDHSQNHYLQLRFNGPLQNPSGIGTKVTLYQTLGEVQYQELMLSRGFQSSVPPLLHFGLGTQKKIDSLRIIWFDGKEQTINKIESNKLLTIKYKGAYQGKIRSRTDHVKPTFDDITEIVNLKHKHQENNFDDYFYQVLLPHKMSAFGPALAIGDIDLDGLDDFYFGGGSGYLGTIYRQQAEGTFLKLPLDAIWKEDDIREDVAATFFDANGDGYPDLYVVSGGNEFHKDTRAYQDRLYINDKHGGFTKIESALPKMYASGSCVVPADFDKDGDLDLFIGGRHIPRNYPLPANSYILRNDSSDSKISFTDVTQELAPELQNIGMVTDAVWADFNNDNALDLVLTGEWMPLSFFTQENGKFKNRTKEHGMEMTSGWWFSINANDFDNDGDVDFVAGNLGLNYKYKASKEASFDIYADDFDDNKSIDIVLGYYNDGIQYPVRGRQCSSQQIPAIEVKFKDYSSFANADLEDVYSTQSLENALHYRTYNFASSYVENQGNEGFQLTSLPNEAQFSSINSILSEDLDKDGHLDLVVSGNLYQSEVETPRNDAGYGLFLKGNGKGGFSPVPYTQSGLLVKGDVKNSEFIQLDNRTKAILFAKNNDSLQVVKINSN